MLYAPVVIGTLSRFEHFKRCIKSLEDNSWAKFTEIYISVDYPPENKYIEGNNAIIEFLKKHKMNFYKTNIIYQNENLGATENYEFLVALAFEHYDRVIVLEDDIEVSPNFLEYMDKALEFGSEKEEVFCVSTGTRWLKIPEKMNGTAYMVQNGESGYGIYRDKRKKMMEEVTEQWLEALIHDSRKMIKIFKNNKSFFYLFINNYVINQDRNLYFRKDGTVRTIDIVNQIYTIVNNMCGILPTVVKCRNWGLDGSGQNAGRREDIEPDKLTMDNDRGFDFILETDKRINKLIRKRRCGHFDSSFGSKWNVWKALLYYFYLRIAHKI